MNAILKATRTSAPKHREVSLAITCAEFLRYFPPTTPDGSEVIWLKIANENENEDARKKLVAMGLLPGAADLIFISRFRTVFVELKAPEIRQRAPLFKLDRILKPKGRLSQDQKEFREKCVKAQIPYEIAYSLEDLWAILKKHRIMNRKFKEN
jgi:hypothetical protein